MRRAYVSADGSIVVAQIEHKNRIQIAVWDVPEDSLSFLPLERNPGSEFRINALGPSGKVVAGDYFPPASKIWRAYTATHDSFRPLRTPAGFSQSSAQAVGQDGQIVVGTAWNGDGHLASEHIKGARVVLWDKGKPKLLSGFDNPDFNWVPWDASEDGSVVVGARWPVGIQGPWLNAEPSRPFYWEKGKVKVFEVAAGVFEDVTPDGQFVVGQCRTGAVIWDQSRGMLRRVEDLLTSRGVDLDGRRLSSCQAISDDGTTLVGNAVAPDGREEAWLAHIPHEAFGNKSP